MTTKRRPFKLNDIVRYENIFGYVKNRDFGVHVCFPDPNDSSSHKDINFDPDGSLLGCGDVRVLFHAENVSQDIGEICRSMSKKLTEVNRRMRKRNKTGNVSDFPQDDEDEDVGF